MPDATLHQLPEPLRSRIGTARAGRAFVEGFSGLVNDIAEKWRLTLQPPFADLSHSWVQPAMQRRAEGGTRDVVLKLSLPGRELQNQAQALREFSGPGCAQLLEEDLERGALLLARVQPGRTLSSLEDDDRAVAIALEVMTRLWRSPPASHSFRTVSRWCRTLLDWDPKRGWDPKRDVARRAGVLADQVPRAQGLLRELLAEPQSPRLLHADFHQFNVLEAKGRTWCAIDPKGAVGDIGFELGPLLRNLLLKTDRPHQRLTLRVRRVATELAQSPQWVLRWGFVHCVLSTLWLVEGEQPGLDDSLGSLRVMADVLG